MISDITLGQFFPGYSPIHKLDPRTKIILATLFIVAVFVANNPASFLLIGVVALILVAVSRISMSVILKGIKPILFILLFTALINIFMTKGEGAPLVEFWIIKIYKEGIIRAILMALRVIILIIGTSILLTYTTSPMDLTDAMERLLSPLKKIGLPIHEFAMMMSLALRFVPTLIEETEKIINAQKARGADFETGNLLQRARALIPILIPLFVSSFTRATELATAMECRCYTGGEGRTRMREMHLTAVDWAVALLFLLFFAAIPLIGNIPFLPGAVG